MEYKIQYSKIKNYLYTDKRRQSNSKGTKKSNKGRDRKNLKK